MGSEQTITHDFDRLLAQYPGFFKELVSYVDDIRQYGTVKQAIAEAEKNLADARAASDEFQVEMRGRHQALQDSHAEKQQRLNAELASRQADIDQLMDAAHKRSESIMQDARNIVDRVLAEGNVARAAVDQRVADAQAQAVDLETKIEDMNQQILDLDTTIQGKQAELTRVNNAISEARAKIA